MNIEQVENFLRHVNASDIHIDSYNNFVCHELPILIQNISTTLDASASENIYFNIEFYDVYVPKACHIKNGTYRKITPSMCRRENLSYTTPIYATIKQTKYKGTEELSVDIYKKMVLAHIPVMVGSYLCHTTLDIEEKNMESMVDSGGYFIINGVERVLVTQRRKCYNFPQLNIDKNTLSVNMRSMSKETNHSVLVEVSTTFDSDEILCSLPYIGKKIPLDVILCAWGINKDGPYSQDEALNYIGSFATRKYNNVDEEQEQEEEEENSSSETEDDQESIIESIPVEYARQILDIEIFPHLGVNAPLRIKYETLISMVKKLLLAKAGKLTSDNRDNLIFHRFETSGILLYELYNMFLRNFLNSYKECSKNGSISDFVNKMELFITKNIKSCMATGKWGIQKGSYVRQGVSQVLSRYSVLGTQSHLHRLMLPVGKEGKNVQIRQIHPSHFGFICLFETPEGQGCGIVLNFTSSVKISKDYPAPYIRDILKNEATDSGSVDIWIDNTFLLKTDDHEKFIQKFKQLRRYNIIPFDISICVSKTKDNEPYEIRIFSEKGRVMRPLLDKNNMITYLDAGEIQNYYVAMTKDEQGYDYCELHPILLLSICAGSIPYLDHIQSPRIVYESSMMKQAIGFFASNYPIRYDTTCEVLDYSQKCFVSTAVGRAFGMHEMPAGINCVVAIMTMGSWNAEDCIILNKAAIERGLFSSTTYKTICIEEYKTKTNDTRMFCVPDKSIRKPIYNYDLLDENGIVKRGSKITKKDIIVGCVQESGSRRDIIQKDCSEISEEEGIVENVEVIKTFLGHRIVNITLKIRKIPECGDKFANLNAQKGTCGLILSPEDMPFCEEDGIIPDLLVNPNALPSRMTISMFFEILFGQECALSGTMKDATAFETITKVGEVLQEHGYEKYGMKKLIDGTTGKPLRAQIFMGVNYYQKLKHMVSNKINSRNFGNVTISTRQPVSGRSKQGGIRAGEMEVQALLSHGVSDFIKEKLFDCSDEFTVLICNKCQNISNHKDQCHICGAELFETNMPYASKLVFQLLNMCSIKTNFRVDIV
jgi:DNA-directed RNA polymerase II subunit RPB2